MPDGWEQVPDAVLREEGVPEETIAAFQRREIRDGQRDNVVVSREKVAASVTALKYSTANIRTIEATPEYELKEKREVKAAGQDTILHIFTARPVPDLPGRIFYQLAIVLAERGYVVTGTLPLSADTATEEELVSLMLSAVAGKQ